MRDRITVKQLEHLVTRINDALGVPDKMYSGRDAKGDLVANENACYLQGVYGGYKIEQMCKSGGSRDLFRMGTTSKRELWALCQAYLAGVEAGTRLSS